MNWVVYFHYCEIGGSYSDQQLNFFLSSWFWFLVSLVQSWNTWGCKVCYINPINQTQYSSNQICIVPILQRRKHAQSSAPFKRTSWERTPGVSSLQVWALKHCTSPQVCPFFQSTSMSPSGSPRQYPVLASCSTSQPQGTRPPSWLSYT